MLLRTFSQRRSDLLLGALLILIAIILSQRPTHQKTVENTNEVPQPKRLPKRLPPPPHETLEHPVDKMDEELDEIIEILGDPTNDQ